MKNKRSFKYTGAAAAYTALVIVLVIAFNIIISALSNRFYSVFNPDISPEKLFDISSNTTELFKTLVSGMTDEEKEILNKNKVTITFMNSEAAVSTTGDENYRRVYEMAKQYTDKFDFIELQFIEPDKNPELVQKFLYDSNTLTSSAINATDVYFTGPSGQYLSVPYLKFYLTDSSNSAGDKYTLYNIESKMTGSILRLFSTSSIAYIVKGHGEQTELTEFRELLEIAGFTVVDVDLTKDKLDYEKGKLIIINSPQKDFGGVNDPVNELKILGDFINYSKVPHHMITFVDSEFTTNGNLSEYLSFLMDYGFYYNSNVVSESVNNLSGNDKIISATYVSSEASTANSNGMGYSFIQNLLNYKTVIRDACTIKIVAPKSSSLNDTYYVDSIITTSGNASAASLEDASVTYDSAYMTLLGIYGHEMIIDNSATYTSYVMAGASSSFISDDYIRTYANRDIIYSALRTMSLNSVDPVVQNISYKEYLASGLTMTGGQQVTWIIIMSAVLPVAILVFGTVVWVRRKNS